MVSKNKKRGNQKIEQKGIMAYLSTGTLHLAVCDSIIPVDTAVEASLKSGHGSVRLFYMKINNITECMNKKQNEQKKRAQHTGCVSDGTDEGTAEVVGINVGVAVIVGAAEVLLSKIVVISCLQSGMNAL